MGGFGGRRKSGGGPGGGLPPPACLGGFHYWRIASRKVDYRKDRCARCSAVRELKRRPEGRILRWAVVYEAAG